MCCRYSLHFDFKLHLEFRQALQPCIRGHKLSLKLSPDPEEHDLHDIALHVLWGTTNRPIEYVGVSAPEPAAIGLLTTAAAGLLLARRRRRAGRNES